MRWTGARLQHARVAPLLVGAGLPKVEGPRDVGGAAVILAAAVHQQHAAAVNGGAGSLLHNVISLKLQAQSMQTEQLKMQKGHPHAASTCSCCQ